MQKIFLQKPKQEDSKYKNQQMKSAGNWGKKQFLVHLQKPHALEGVKLPFWQLGLEIEDYNSISLFQSQIKITKRIQNWAVQGPKTVVINDFQKTWSPDSKAAESTPQYITGLEAVLLSYNSFSNLYPHALKCQSQRPLRLYSWHRIHTVGRKAESWWEVVKQRLMFTPLPTTWSQILKCSITQAKVFTPQLIPSAKRCSC